MERAVQYLASGLLQHTNWVALRRRRPYGFPQQLLPLLQRAVDDALVLRLQIQFMGQGSPWGQWGLDDAEMGDG